MKIYILGIDGYLGWPLAVHLKLKGYKVFGCDTFLRRRLVSRVGSDSATPILPLSQRLEYINSNFGDTPEIKFRISDATNYEHMVGDLREIKPNAIVHLAEYCSAPYSMISRACASDTLVNNIQSTVNVIYAIKAASPHAHLVKLGTMGEYGQPEIEISEGEFEVEYKGSKAMLPFPRMPGSTYHCSKVCDSVFLRFVTELWGLRVTDIMQGVVFGVTTPEIKEEKLLTRFDFDECFGTVINRFVAQAIVSHPITPYGAGGQTRGFLPLRDSIQCMTLIIKNPPEKGKYREINQLESLYTIRDLAKLVKMEADYLGLDAKIAKTPNPRIEKEGHFYKVECEQLFGMGYKPSDRIDLLVREMIKDLQPYKKRMMKFYNSIKPRTKWR